MQLNLITRVKKVKTHSECVITIKPLGLFLFGPIPNKTIKRTLWESITQMTNIINCFFRINEP